MDRVPPAAHKNSIPYPGHIFQQVGLGGPFLVLQVQPSNSRYRQRLPVALQFLPSRICNRDNSGKKPGKNHEHSQHKTQREKKAEGILWIRMQVLPNAWGAMLSRNKNNQTNHDNAKEQVQKAGKKPAPGRFADRIVMNPDQSRFDDYVYFAFWHGGILQRRWLSQLDLP